MPQATCEAMLIERPASAPSAKSSVTANVPAKTPTERAASTASACAATVNIQYAIDNARYANTLPSYEADRGDRQRICEAGP